MMSDAASEPIGYAAAFDAYWQLGWRGVLPGKHKRKWPPPPFVEKPDTPSYTGYAGIFPSYADVMAWADDFRDGNLYLRLPDGIIGVDVDAYDERTGGQTLTVAQARWGPLPPTSRSTSRLDDPISGIRLFRVPPNTHLETKIGFPDLGCGHIEIIQRHHRYCVAWPSIHPEDRTYWWVNDSMQHVGIPDPAELPWLPQRWVDALRIDHRSNLDNLSIDIRDTLTEGAPSPLVSARMTEAIRAVNAPGADRHDTCLPHVLALMRLGKNGESGVKQALQLLCNVFVALVTSDGSRTEMVARNEFERMVTNDNAARELATPGITDWVKDLVIDEAPPVPGDGGELSSAEPDQPVASPSPAPPDSDSSAESPTGAPVRDGAANANAPSGNEDRRSEPTRPRSQLEEIEQGFWDSRESLRMVWQTSMSKMCSPWAVLAQCAARALAQVRPCVTLPDIIGGPGSLNWFTAITAVSGRGKGASGACSRLLVPQQVLQRNLGTGEGILDAYIKPANKETGEPRSIHESVMLSADEVDTLAALRSRSGSTLMGILRSGFSGETLGFSYRSNSTHLEAHTYRMTMVLSVQPEKADWIISDAAGGTPQRLMWFPASDRRITKKRPWPASALTLPSPSEWLYPREIIIPNEAKDLIEDAQVDRNNETVDALDGHALFCREKFAYALTVLDGRVEMTLEDWQLSGIAADISTFTRDATVEAIRAAARIDALDRGEIRGMENAAADESKQLEEADRVRAVLRGILEKIGDAGEEGIATRELTQRTSARNRRWLAAALQIGQSNGLISANQETKRWVKL